MDERDAPQSASTEEEAGIGETPAVFANKVFVSPLPGGAKITFAEARRVNEQSRRRYEERRAKGLCTSCGEPAQGASRCSPCAEKSYHGSAYFRGIPVWEPVLPSTRNCEEKALIAACPAAARPCTKPL